MKYSLLQSSVVHKITFASTLLLIISLLSLSSPILSQDNPTPTDSPTNTEIPTDVPVPTDTATLEPTLTETPLPTETETPTLTETAVDTLTPSPIFIEIPTETATGDLTETPTATGLVSPVETPSETITLTASPTLPALSTELPLTQLVNDNFDTGDTSNWTLGNGWLLVPSEGGQALQVNGSDEPVTFVQNNLSDAAIQMRFIMNTGAVRLSLRQSEAGAYTATIDMNGNLSLYRGENILASSVVNPIKLGEWRTIRLSTVGDVIQVIIDGSNAIATEDVNPLPPGTTAFGGIGIVDGALRVDDTEVWVGSPETGNENITTPSLTPSYTATASATSVVQIVPPPGLNLLFGQEFDGKRSPYDQLSGYLPQYVQYGGYFGLQISADNQPVKVSPNKTPDRAIEIRSLISSGAVKLTIRKSDVGDYSAFLYATGQLDLYRNDQKVSSTTTNSVLVNQWHTFRLSAIGDLVEVYVDEVELISFKDNAPLPGGTITFEGVDLGGSNLFISEINIWGVVPPLPPVSNRGSLARPNSNNFTFFGFDDGIGSGENPHPNPAQITSITPSGYKAIQLPPEVWEVFEVNWSADGQHIVFGCLVDYGSDPNRFGFDICKIDANGTNYLDVTRPVDIFDYPQRLLIETSPYFSPTVNQIVFNTYNRPGGSGIFIKDMTSLAETRLNTLSTGAAVWGSDNYIHFQYSGEIYKQYVFGGSPTVEVSATNAQLLASLSEPVQSIYLDDPTINGRGDLAYTVHYNNQVGVGLTTNSITRVIRQFCAADLDFAPLGDAIAITSLGPQYNCPDNEGNVIIADENGNELRQFPLTYVVLSPFDWHKQVNVQATPTISSADMTATAIVIISTGSVQSLTATASAQSAALTATARATKTITPTPQPNCEIQSPVGANFRAAGGLSAFELPNSYGHGYSNHVITTPEIVWIRALSGKVSQASAFWDFAPVVLHTAFADDAVEAWLLQSQFGLVPWSQNPGTTHNSPYLVWYQPLVPVQQSGVVLGYQFIQTTGYGFELDRKTNTVVPFQPKGVIVHLNCNLVQRTPPLRYTIRTAYPANKPF